MGKRKGASLTARALISYLQFQNSKSRGVNVKSARNLFFLRQHELAGKMAHKGGLTSFHAAAETTDSGPKSAPERESERRQPARARSPPSRRSPARSAALASPAALPPAGARPAGEAVPRERAADNPAGWRSVGPRPRAGGWPPSGACSATCAPFLPGCNPGKPCGR